MNHTSNSEHKSHHVVEETRRFFQKVYAWMFFGLLVSAAVAYYVSVTDSLVKAILGNSLMFYGLLIFQLVLVFTLVWVIKKIPASVATILFILYCFTTGLTLSVIFLVYTITSIGMVFAITAGMFGAMSIYGFFTKSDLTGIGQVLIMGLIGVIIASVVNIFLQNSMFDFILSIISVIIFAGLTAYDTQKIKKMNVIGNEGTDEDKKEAIIGALRLYLDFINLFLNLLRLFGKRR